MASLLIELRDDRKFFFKINYNFQENCKITSLKNINPIVPNKIPIKIVTMT